jgi:hypothetical protein
MAGLEEMQWLEMGVEDRLMDVAPPDRLLKLEEGPSVLVSHLIPFRCDNGSHTFAENMSETLNGFICLCSNLALVILKRQRVRRI